MRSCSATCVLRWLDPKSLWKDIESDKNDPYWKEDNVAIATDFLDKRIEYYYNNTLVLRLFGNNDRCIVYNYSENKLTHFGTFNLVMMYMFFMYIYYYVNKDNNNVKLYKTLIGKLYTTRINYLDKNKLTVVDESPFKDFTFKCMGIPLNPKRHSFLEKAKKKKSGKKIVWRYTPTGEEVNIPKIIFDNCSGNEIKK